MVRKSSCSSEGHRCSAQCLGPLVFHSQTKGECIRLSKHGRCAQQDTNTFKNGLLFSCRSVRVQEKVRLRIDTHRLNWTGALRVGFTTVPPSARTADLPCMAIPCLTKLPGHWAAPVKDSMVRTGALLEFWVSDSGCINVCINDGFQWKLLSGVDISRPLWAMIDVYGQTCGITLLGSVKKELFRTRKSCPAPKYRTPTAPSLDPCRDLTQTSADKGICEECVVCLAKEAQIIVKPCGHQCLCSTCAIRILEDFGTCPMCRQVIRSGEIAA
ncbi:E3 ubiquitin-protein ligase NEURL3 [Eucyclogobius newberryi]|uniref:E3 ubiquitin-protein ligase NEURL3 n=1 Tax=Eucyclogobius newberryi TaxID=166745 RepID=UPI003B5BC7F3